MAVRLRLSSGIRMKQVTFIFATIRNMNFLNAKMRAHVWPSFPKRLKMKKHEPSVSWDGKHMPLHSGSYVYILYVCIYIYVCVFAILFSIIQGATYSGYWNATNFNHSCWGIIRPHIQFLLWPTVKQIVWIVYRGRKRAHHKSWLK